MRKKDLSERDEPRCTKSSTDIEEPERTCPRIDNLVQNCLPPTRAKDLRESAEPKPREQNTDKEDAKRVLPTSENEAPNRTQLRRDNDAP